MEYSDKELLDFLERQNKLERYTGSCIFRISQNNRGWRLHETSQTGASTTVRAAITKALKEDKKLEDIMSGRDMK